MTAPVLELGENYRVRDLDALQWVFEIRSQPRQDSLDSRPERVGERWLPFAYCRSRLGLETALSRLGVSVDKPKLAHLPEWFEPNVLEHVQDRVVAENGLGIGQHNPSKRVRSRALRSRPPSRQTGAAPMEPTVPALFFPERRVLCQ
jgi:hypothetical protein